MRRGVGSMGAVDVESEREKKEGEKGGGAAQRENCGLNQSEDGSKLEGGEGRGAFAARRCGRCR